MKDYFKGDNVKMIEASNLRLFFSYKTLHLEEALTKRYLFACKLCKYFTIREESFNAHMVKQHEEQDSKANISI